MPVTPQLWELGLVFARYANFTFGGGSATIDTLHREVVERRRWLAEEPFQFAFALSRINPGTNLLAFCAAIGWLLKGFPGAVVTLLASSVPCALLVAAVTVAFDWWSRNHYVSLALKGALAAAVAVTLITGVTLIRPHWHSVSAWKLLVFAGGAFLLAQGFGVPPFRVLLAAAIGGAFWPARTTNA